MADFDFAKAIEEFLVDPSRRSLELPHMTTGQRKNARKLAEQHPDLKCESYGFGQDRQLHLFKRISPQPSPTDKNTLCATPAFSVKNTFIDDWSGAEPEPIIFRSTPAPLNKQLLDALAADICSKSVESPAADDVSTTASHGHAPSTIEGSSPLSPADLSLPDLVEELQVRNTFIHIEDSSADERAVQSMPHGMFGQLLAQEQEELLPEVKPKGPSGFLLAPLLDADFVPEKEVKPKGPSGFLLEPLLNFDSSFQPLPEVRPTGASGLLLAPLLDTNSCLWSLPETVLPPPSSPPNVPAPSSPPNVPPPLNPPSSPPNTPPPSSTPSTPPPAYEAVLNVPPPTAGVLPSGAKVILQGLIKLPTFNGKPAVVDSWDAEAGRYAVSVESAAGVAQQAKVKPENLRLMAR